MLPNILHEDGFNHLVQGRYGYVLSNRNDFVVGLSIRAYGEYFEEEVNVFRSFIQPGHHVADIGANIGTHTLAMARLVGTQGWVYAFEAQRTIFQTLCANMAVNSLPNVDCEHLAIDERSGSILVEESDCSAPNNFGGLSLGSSQANRSVRCVSLDEYFHGRRLDFAKLDVEGMEEACLRGGKKILRANKTILYVENDRVDKSASLLECLLTLGYEVYWHLPAFFNPDNYAKAIDRVHGFGLLDKGGEHFESIGFAINVLCVPQARNLKVEGLLKVENLEEHPLRREPSRFHPGDCALANVKTGDPESAASPL